MEVMEKHVVNFKKLQNNTFSLPNMKLDYNATNHAIIYYSLTHIYTALIHIFIR